MNHQPRTTRKVLIRSASRWSVITVGSLLFLAGCKQPQIEPPIDAPVPPIPSPVPAPPSLPSPTPTPPSLPSPTPAPPTSAPPSIPNPSSTPAPGSDGPSAPTPPGAPPPGGQDTASGPAGREEAGEELEKAGQKVAEAAGGLPAPNKGREYVVKRTGDNPRDEAHDPLAIPAESGAEDGESTGTETAGGDSESVDEAAGEAGDGLPESGDPSAADEAQQAVAEAAEVLQRAGEILRNAETEEDMARAAEVLSDARIAVIVAGQVLNDAAAENPEHGEDYDEAQQVLSDANVAIVLAGQTLYGLPEYEPTTEEAFPGDEAEDELDRELEESLEIFDRQIADARSTVLGDGGGIAKDGDGIPTGGIILTGGGIPDEEPSPEEEAGSIGVKPDEGGFEDVPPNEPQPDDALLIPEDVGDGQDDDIVAQQLREAAIAEKDPDLREKLWEEYRRYKSSF